MHVISQKMLREFWDRHADAESPLRAWFGLVKKAEWGGPDEMKELFGAKVDQYRQFTIFDIGGNKYRLIAVINYQNQKVFVRRVLTHKAYDRGEWRKDPFTVKRFGRGRAENGEQP